MNKFKAGIKIEPEYTIVLKNVKTGKERKYKFGNLITNTGWDRLEYKFSLDNYSYTTYSILASKVQIGSGTGTPAATDTALFTYQSEKNTSYVSHSIDADGLGGYFEYRGFWATSEGNGITYTEVGAKGSQSSNITTHALIKDSGGSTTTLVKTSSDEMYIYVKINFTISVSSITNSSNITIIKQNLNGLINQLVWGGYINDYEIYLGYSQDAVAVTDDPVKSQIIMKDQDDIGFSITVGTKKVTYECIFSSTEGNNANGIKEVGFAFDSSSSYEKIFRAVMPVGNWVSKTLPDELLGTGNGSIGQVLTADWKPIMSGTETVKVDGVTKTKDTDYSINYTTGEITSIIAFGSGLDVTMTYDVDFVPKDTDYTFAMSFELVFS